MANEILTLPGRSYPIGATAYSQGVNFSLFSRNATSVELLLFDSEDHSQPTHVLQLDPEINKSFYYWHCFIPGLNAGQLYAYRVHGPFEPQNGHRFDGNKVLLDPYAKAVVSKNYTRKTASLPGDNCAQAMKSVVVDSEAYDWEGDRPLNHPFSKSIIYEMHVGGFTKDPSSGLSKNLRGTYLGLIEKIPYLKELGITAVELLPVQQFDPWDVPGTLINYWGYSPIAFFAPHNGYASSNDPLAPVNEFKDMVKALHKAGIEVILDVVFNHTAEGDQSGPTLCHKGIENVAYYILNGQKQFYKNYSGTGNTLNANHSIVRRMIRDCLKYWVSEMHVDGFRFDLASILSRDEQGRPLENPPLLWGIESDPVLANTKIIAEAWDVETFQVGKFVGHKWAEWNGIYRDDVRKFVKGDEGMIYAMAQRLSASPDVFNTLHRDPHRSINFITAHDGFTMNDLVSYNEKHNWANQEENRDGHNANYSWNSGVEGPTNDPAIEALRIKQIKNFFAILILSQGTPMMLMGDEIRRTQQGNNNAYCQDNEINWMNWDKVEQEKELLRFVQKLNKLKLTNSFFQQNQFWNYSALDQPSTIVNWHGTKLEQPDWGHFSRSLAFSLHHPDRSQVLHVMLNTYWEPLRFEIPRPDLPDQQWHHLINTAVDAPNDIFDEGKGPVFDGRTIEVQARSLVALITT